MTSCYGEHPSFKLFREVKWGQRFLVSPQLQLPLS